jgi:hypothetical protein
MWTSNAGSIRIQRTLLKTNRGLEVGETKTASSRRTIPVGKTATQALRAHRTRQIEERFKVGLAGPTTDSCLPMRLAGCWMARA